VNDMSGVHDEETNDDHNDRVDDVDDNSIKNDDGETERDMGKASADTYDGTKN